MNRNITPLLLIVLALGIYFTFTRTKLDELKAIRDTNTEYKKAIDDSEALVKQRNKVIDNYEKISQDDRENLAKILPDSVDNVRLIIDVLAVASRHSLALKNMKTSSSEAKQEDEKRPSSNPDSATKLPTTPEIVTLSFSVESGYQNFINLLKDLEVSMRIIEISKITLDVKEGGLYNYGVELKTFWLN